MGILTEAPRYVLEIGFVVAIGGHLARPVHHRTPRGRRSTVLGVFAAASLRALPTLNRVAATSRPSAPAASACEIVLSASTNSTRRRARRDSPRRHPIPRRHRIRDLSFRYPDADTPVLDGSVADDSSRTRPPRSSARAARARAPCSTCARAARADRRARSNAAVARSSTTARPGMPASASCRRTCSWSTTPWRSNIAFGVAARSIDVSRVDEVIGDRAAGPISSRAARRPRHGRRGARRAPVGRPAPAPRTRPRPLPPPDGAGARRGDVGARQRDRARDHRDARAPQGQPHDPHRRPPPLDRAGCRHPGVPQGRPHRGHRHLRRGARRQRGVRPSGRPSANCTESATGRGAPTPEVPSPDTFRTACESVVRPQQ